MKNILVLLILITLTGSHSAFAINEEMYPEGFEVVQKMGSSFQVVILGDEHGAPNPELSVKNGQFRRGVPIVKEMGMDGDLILVESEDWKGPKHNLHDVLERNHPLRVLDKGFRIGGWDNIDLASFTKGYYELSIINYASPNKENQIRASFYNKLVHTIGVRDRNRAMIQAIEIALAEGYERVFVFAGTKHVLARELREYFYNSGISHLILGREIDKLKSNIDVDIEGIKNIYTKLGQFSLQVMLDMEKKFVKERRDRIMNELGAEFPDLTDRKSITLSCRNIFM